MLLVIGGSEPVGYQGEGTNSYGNGRANNAVGSESRDSWDRDHGGGGGAENWEDPDAPNWGTGGVIHQHPSTMTPDQRDNYDRNERSVPDRNRSGH